MAMHEDSCICIDTGYDYFNVPPTETSSVKNFFSKVFPLTNLSQGGPIEFNLKANKADFIDLAHSYLQLKVKVLKLNGAAPTKPTVDADGNEGAIPVNSKVFPVNYLGGALFKDVQLYIGNKLISSSNNLYAYKSYLEYVLSFKSSVQETFGEVSYFYKDTKDFNEVTAFDADHNIGAKKRFEKSKYGKSFQIITKIHNDLFNQSKKFPGDIDMKVRFLRNDTAFALMAKNKDMKYKIEIEEAVLMIKRVTLEDTFLREIEKSRLPESFMKFPFRRVEVKYSTQGPNKSILQENRMISNDELPKRIIVGLVDSRSFDGNLDYNPYNFQNFKLTDIVLQRGEDVSPFHEMKLDYESDQYYEAYAALIYGTGRLFENDSISVTPEEFKSGFTLYCFDLSKSLPNSGTFELTESGTINIIATLKDPLDHGVVMVFLNEYDGMLAIGPNNQPEVVLGSG